MRDDTIHSIDRVTSYHRKAYWSLLAFFAGGWVIALAVSWLQKDLAWLSDGFGTALLVGVTVLSCIFPAVSLTQRSEVFFDYADGVVRHESAFLWHRSATELPMDSGQIHYQWREREEGEHSYSVCSVVFRAEEEELLIVDLFDEDEARELALKLSEQMDLPFEGGDPADIRIEESARRARREARNARLAERRLRLRKSGAPPKRTPRSSRTPEQPGRDSRR